MFLGGGTNYGTRRRSALREFSPTIFSNRYSHSERPQLLSRSYITQCTVTYSARMDEFSTKFVSSSIVRVVYDGISTDSRVRFPAAFCPYYRTRRKHSTPCCLFARPHCWNMQSPWYQREKSRLRSTAMLGHCTAVWPLHYNFVPKTWSNKRSRKL